MGRQRHVLRDLGHPHLLALREILDLQRLPADLEVGVGHGVVEVRRNVARLPDLLTRVDRQVNRLGVELGYLEVQGLTVDRHRGGISEAVYTAHVVGKFRCTACLHEREIGVVLPRLEACSVVLPRRNALQHVVAVVIWLPVVPLELPVGVHEVPVRHLIAQRPDLDVAVISDFACGQHQRGIVHAEVVGDLLPLLVSEVELPLGGGNVVPGLRLFRRYQTLGDLFRSIQALPGVIRIQPDHPKEPTLRLQFFIRGRSGVHRTLQPGLLEVLHEVGSAGVVRDVLQRLLRLVVIRHVLYVVLFHERDHWPRRSAETHVLEQRLTHIVHSHHQTKNAPVVLIRGMPLINSQLLPELGILRVLHHRGVHHLHPSISNQIVKLYGFVTDQFGIQLAVEVRDRLCAIQDHDALGQLAELAAHRRLPECRVGDEHALVVVHGGHHVVPEVVATIPPQDLRGLSLLGRSQVGGHARKILP